ncbi:MAG TPA: hypothetical protein DCM14_08925, partial [Clostridiales bacterium UBA8153]|nr:hypothetical protein [Clostridiales bacterium UBA8153]
MALKPEQLVILVGLGTCGLAAGGGPVLRAIQDELAAQGSAIQQQGLDIEVRSTGCAGLCEAEVLVEVQRAGGRRVRYGKVKPDLARRIVSEDVVGGRPIAESIIYQEDPGLPVSRPADKQLHIVLENCGFIDP